MMGAFKNKESIIQKKILPYFAKRKLSEITARTSSHGRM